MSEAGPAPRSRQPPLPSPSGSQVPGEGHVPAVVAVVVAADPGEWFEETLASLATQDYEDFSVLVVAPQETPDPSGRVAEVLPGAFVRSVEATHFSAAVNAALATVSGAAFLLLCHDDVALAPDAVRLLVEESFRSNAGIVSPKMTSWDDPRVLLHVGQSADKTGAVVDRLQPGEVDHGQHDGVRDVFVAPGGCVLVRADLFREIEGMDGSIEAMGEDLDLCWRAQIAGSRVVVAPQASVRHLETLVNGRRELAEEAGAPRPASLEHLERRHELRAVLTCYGWWHLLRVVPQVVALSVGEVLVALVSGDTARARDVLGAWSWNLRHHSALRQRRAVVRAHRQRRDGEVRHLQNPGSARLSAYFTQFAHLGVVAAREGSDAEPLAADAEPELTGSVGGAFSEDASFDEIEDRRRVGRIPALSTQRARVLTWIVVAVLLLVGSRQLLRGAMPIVGQLVPLPSWTSAWHQFFSGWQPAGLGSGAPSTPAYGVLGLVGTVLLGGMGLVQKVLVLGCIPLGAWGVVRLLRPLCSPRARLAGGLAYLGLPLAYNALAQGRWDGLVAFAVTPWVVARLARASELGPFEPPAGWRGTLAGQILTLGVIEAVAVSFAPAVAVVVLLVGIALPLGSLVSGRAQGLRALGVSIGASVVAAVLCIPWSVSVLLSGRQMLEVLGLPVSASSGWSWSTILRFAVGPTGSSPLSWLLVIAAFLPLLVSRGPRLAWAARLWTLALSSWVLAWMVQRHWTGSFAPQVDVLLAPAACAVAAAIGIGIASFEEELTHLRFGWLQLCSFGALVAAVVGLLPVLIQVGDGSWGLPRTDLPQSLTWISSSKPPGGFRVLWLADPRSLLGGGWSVQPGLAYSVSEGGTPNGTNVWAPPSSGPADRLAQAISLAETGRTSTLGQLLATSGIRYVVLMETLAPSAPGVQSAKAFPTPPDVLEGLLEQDGLRVVPGGEGYTVFANGAYVPERAQRSAALGAVSSEGPWGRPSDVVGWHGVLGTSSGATNTQGSLSRGPMVAAHAPAGLWHLTVGGRSLAQSSAYGWAAAYAVPATGQAVLQVSPGPLVPFVVTLEMLAWIGVAGVLLVYRRHRPHVAIPALVSDAENAPPAGVEEHEVLVGGSRSDSTGSASHEQEAEGAPQGPER